MNSNRNMPLVSVITSCWNGERYIHKYFDNILKQTYQNIELIFVNNGSSDKTGEIALSYSEQLKDRGIIFKYIHLEKNAYTAGGKLAGIKMFSGDYFFLPDSDDILYPEHIQKKVDFLEKNNDFGLVVCQLRIVNEKKPNVGIGILKREKPNGIDNHFEDLILGKNVVYTGIGYMIRRSAFLEVNPEKDIYISPYGENFQILLPLLYGSKCGYLEQVIGDYMVRDDSFTKTVYVEKRIESFESQKITIFETLKRIQPVNLDYYLDLTEKKYMRAKYRHALEINNSELMKKYYLELKKTKRLNLVDRMEYVGYRVKIISIFLKISRILRKKIVTSK